MTDSTSSSVQESPVQESSVSESPVSESPVPSAPKKHFSFLKFLLVYGLVLLVVILAGLGIFWKYISAYEQSRPVTAVTNYVGSLDSNDIMALAQQYIAGLDHKVQSDDDLYTYLDTVFNSYEYAKSTSRSTEDHPVYVLRTDGIIFGEITLSRGEEGSFGFTPWTVSAVNYNFDDLFTTSSVTVPSDYSAYFNGTLLSNKFITDDAVKYELLEQFYDNEDIESLPYLKEYTYTYAGEDLLEVKDASGTPVPGENLNEDYYDNNCSSDEKAMIESFADEFVARYVKFTSNADWNTSANYYSLIEYVVSGSQLQQRLLAAVGGLGFASSKGDEVKSIVVNRYMNTGTGYYAFDVTYKVETLGQNGYVTTTNNIKLAIVPRDYGHYAAVALYTY